MKSKLFMLESMLKYLSANLYGDLSVFQLFKNFHI